MAYRQSSVRSMENTAIRFGTDAAPGIIAKRKEEEAQTKDQKRIDYIRNNVK